MKTKRKHNSNYFVGKGGLADIGHPIVDGDVLADKLGERDTVLRRVMEPYPFENTL